MMAGKEISVKKYVVRLSGEEREQLEALIRKGKSPAQRLLKARILLKADVSEAGAGWSDSRIIKALDTSVSMVYRVRKQLLEEGFEAVLSRKQRATPAVARIFDGEKEAKLIALACSKPPKGRARWTLRLLEKKVVELQIVDRASDSTIGRALKQTFSSLGLDHFEGRSWTGLHPMAPHPRGHEMVQLVILAWCQPRRHWLDALAIARSNQSRDISGHIRRRAL
jgi:transposase